MPQAYANVPQAYADVPQAYAMMPHAYANDPQAHADVPQAYAMVPHAHAMVADDDAVMTDAVAKKRLAIALVWAGFPIGLQHRHVWLRCNQKIRSRGNALYLHLREMMREPKKIIKGRLVVIY